MKEVPGVQCLWNKYAEDGLQNGGFSFVKEFMDGLLSGSCEIHFHFGHNRWRESCFTTISFSLRSLCFLFQFFFGLLKFSLLLHNEKVEVSPGRAQLRIRSVGTKNTNATKTNHSRSQKHFLYIRVSLSFFSYSNSIKIV